MEASWPGTPALTPAPISIALTPDPSSIGWARGATRRRRKARNDEVSPDDGFSKASGVVILLKIAAGSRLKTAPAASFINPVTSVQHQILPTPLDGGARRGYVRHLVHLATAPTESFVECLEPFLAAQP